MEERAAPRMLSSLSALDAETAMLVRLAALFAGGSESEVRAGLIASQPFVRASWIEELVLQTYLFAGFPRALNAAREWRRVSGSAAPEEDEGSRYDVAGWEARGIETCATVYGPLYERLRVNIRDLHPALDTWMIVEGYGKVLGRPGLDLARRELCVVAACAISRQDRQLHSHLHGALHAGATRGVIDATFDALADLIADGDMRGYRGLWARVQGK